MTFCDVIDQLLDQYCFSYPCTTKQSDFSSFCIRLNQIDNFNTCKKYFLGSCQILKLRWLTMDRISTFIAQLRKTINSSTYYVKQTTADLVTHWHSNRSTCIFYDHTST